MGAINSISGYYQLSSLLSSGSGSSTLTAAGSTSSTLSLAQALDAADSGSSQSGASAYILDLSPQAQQWLSAANASTSSASGASSDFTLTNAQQTEIKNIIDKYKNAPLDQATFDSIQNDLSAAGLSPQTLAAKDQVSSFNPTNVLLSALNGNYATIQTPASSAAAEQTKETNYLQSIVSLWKSDSAAASSASGSATSASAVSA